MQQQVSDDDDDDDGATVTVCVAGWLQVLDDDGNDVTPQPLSQADPSGAHQAKGDRFFVEDITGGSASEQATAAGSFTMPFSRYMCIFANNVLNQSNIRLSKHQPYDRRI